MILIKNIYAIHTTPLVLDKTLIHIEELSLEDFEIAALCISQLNRLIIHDKVYIQ